MFTYTYLGTNDLERAIKFYDATMRVLGHERCITGDAEWDGISAGWGIYAAALANGGTSEGPPGLRPQYNPDFYAAYVRDPDGNKLAVVCRGFTAP